MAGTIDILDLLFNQFLRISPTTIAQYSTPQQQLLNLFLIPHIILFLFIYGFAWVLVPTHKGLRYLASIGAYLSVILMGSPYSYYGTLVPFFLIWWQVALFVGLFFFIWSRFIHPSKVPELFNIGRAAASKLGEKNKKREAIEEEIESIKKQVAVLESEANRPGEQESARAYIHMQIANLKARQKDLESRV